MYGWYLFWEVHIFRDGLLPTQRTLFVDVLHLLAKIGPLIDQAYQAILDGQVDVCAVLDLLGEVAFGFDGEGFAAGNTRQRLRSERTIVHKNGDIRGRRVWCQIDLVNGEGVLVVLLAELKRVVARHIEIIVKDMLIAAEKRKGFGCCKGGEKERQKGSGELHSSSLDPRAI